MRQAQNFVIVIDRFGGEKFKLERFFRTIAKYSDSFVVWLSPFIDRPREQTRIFEQISVEGARPAIANRIWAFLLQIIVTQCDSCPCCLRVFDADEGRN